MTGTKVLKKQCLILKKIVNEARISRQKRKEKVIDMLKEYRDVPNIKNKLGVDVPVFMISINEDVREATIQAMTSKGYKDIYAKEHLQEFIDYVFDFHREKFGEDHGANLCKDDNDVWKMYMKHKYNHIKKIVHLRGKNTAIDLFDYPEDFIYAGVYLKTYYDEEKIDTESSEVKIFHVHPAYHGGMETFELSFDDFKKIQEKFNSIMNQ